MRLALKKVNDEQIEFIFKILVIFELILIFFYVLIRAFILSITYDEAFTYLSVLKFEIFYIANNHLLNTILVVFFVTLFGPFEIILRIPALIGCVLYLLGSYKVSKLIFKKNLFFLISILILTLNPMILDFLSICRGYSLALGFMMVGIYFFLKTLMNIGLTHKNNFYSFLLLALSTTAVSTFIYVFLTVFFLSCLIEINKILKSNKDDFKNFSFIKKFIFLLKQGLNNIIKPLIPSFIILTLYVGFFMIPIYLYSYGLYWVAPDFNSTVISLIKGILQEPRPDDWWDTYKITPLVLIFEIFMYFSVVIFSIITIKKIIYFLLKKKKFLQKDIIFFSTSALFFIPIPLLFLQYIVQTIINSIYFTHGRGNFPLARAGIFFLPLFIIFLISLWKYIFDIIVLKYENKNLKKKKKFHFT